MKKKFEIPEMEVFFVEVKDQIMDPGGCNSGFECPDGICPLVEDDDWDPKLSNIF